MAVLTTTFNESSIEQQRALEFGDLSHHKCNAYSLAVIDQNGDTVTGSATGIVSVMLHSPGADRPTTLPPVNLATDDRKFPEFLATINRAVFSVTGLSAGHRVTVTASRRPRATPIAIGDTFITPTPGILRFWTPNYSGGFVQFSEWTAQNSRIEVDIFYAGGNIRNAYILDSSGVRRPFLIIGLSTNLNFTSDYDLVTVDGTPVTTGSTPIEIGFHRLVLTSSNGISVSLLSSFRGNVGTEGFLGQISNLRLTDLENPSNSRYYPSTIVSAEQPDSLVLVDELGTPVNSLIGGFIPASRVVINDSSVTITNGASGGENNVSINADIMEGRFYRIQFPERLKGTPGAFISDALSPRGRETLPSGVIAVRMATQNETRVRIGTNSSAARDSIEISNTLSIEEVTDGILTNFPAQQPWVPLLGSGQAYLGNREGNGFIRGVNAVGSQLTSNSLAGQLGSWGTDRPPIGSLFRSGDVLVQVTDHSGSFIIDYATANGTNDEIQAAFEYPNVFMIDVFDSSTEAYCGNTDAVENNGTYFRGVQLLVSGGSAGMYLLSRSGGTTIPVSGTITPIVAPVGSTLTANNGAALLVTDIFRSGNGVVASAVSGTPEQIQTGFQWPNHFTVTPP